MSDLIFIPPAASSKPARDGKSPLFFEKTTPLGTVSFDRFLKEADEKRFQIDQSREKGDEFGLDKGQGKTGPNKDEYKAVDVDRIDRDERELKSKPGQGEIGGEKAKNMAQSEATDTDEEKDTEKVSGETDHQNEDESNVNLETVVLLTQSAEAQVIIEGGVRPEAIPNDENNDIMTGVERVETVQATPVLTGDEIKKVIPGEGVEALPLDTAAAKVETVKSNLETSIDLEQIHQVFTPVSAGATPYQTKDESLSDQGRNPGGNLQVTEPIKNVGVEVVGENQGQTFSEMVSAENVQTLKTETDVHPLAEQIPTRVSEGKVNLAVLQTQLAVNDAPEVKAEPQVLSVVPTQPGVGNSSWNQVSGPSEITAMNKEELFSQIVEHAKVMVNGGGSEMEVSLKPEHLGKLQLKVTIENEVVTAKFITESQQVKEAIESNLSQLKRDLQANGMQVDTILVSVGYQQGNEGFEQASYNGERSDNFSGVGNNVADEGVLETEPPVPDLKGDRVIDLIA